MYTWYIPSKIPDDEVVFDSPGKKRKKKKKTVRTTELELSFEREIFVWPGRHPSWFFIPLYSAERGMKFARPRDTYGGVIKIHVAFGYIEPAVLTPRLPPGHISQ